MKDWLLLLTFACALGGPKMSFSQSQVEDSELIYLGTTEPLRDRFKALEGSLPETYNRNGEWKAIGQKFDPPNLGPRNPDALPKGEDPIRQPLLRNDNIVRPIVLVDGLESRGFLPGDPSGDIGENYYIQMTNGTASGSQILILDKRGDIVAGPSDSEPLFWDQFGVDGQGDPIVMYDEHAKRWVLTEFAPPGDDMLLIAVSATSDPLGAYHAYVFNTPRFPDYPKFGVWPNAYTVSTNEGGDPDVTFYAMERDKMLEGAPARIQRFGVPRYNNFFGGFAWQVPTVADWDGDLAPDEDAPAIVMRIYDDSWEGGQDRLDLYEFNIDWSNPNNSGVGPRIEIPTAPFESDVCEDGLFSCIANPNGQLMGALQQVIMNRLQYRRFPTHETIVGCFTMDANGENLAGIRWFELRKLPGEQWELYQEGTMSPDDEFHRFMGSIAMDADGHIALGYSTVSDTENPALRYTGRRAGDPLGIMTLQEFEFELSTRPNDNVRWGDYASMNVDPIDQNSFWFTGQYRTTDTWRTRILNISLDQDSIDVKPVLLRSPERKAFYTSSEPVEVIVQNAALDTLRSFQLTVDFGEGIVLDTFVENISLAPYGDFIVSFGETVDLSGAENLEAEVIATTADDANVRNDTMTVFHSETFAGMVVLGELNLESFLNCRTDGTVELGISNNSFNDLTEIDFLYSINGGVEESLSWEGFIDNNSFESISLGISGLVSGVNDLTLRAIALNGQPLPVPLEISTSETLDFDRELVTLEIVLDSFPDETRWILRDPDTKAFLLSGGPFFDPLDTVRMNLCLEEACYEMALLDQRGNGICCDFGEGAYRVYSEEQDQVYISGSQFGLVDTQDFCIPFTCLLEFQETVVQDASSFGIADGSILVRAGSGVEPIQYSIDGGDFEAEAFFDELEGNRTYQIVARDQNGCTESISVFVDAPVSAESNSHSDVLLQVLPNPTDGVFQIEMRGNLSELQQQFDIFDMKGRVVQTGTVVRYGQRWVTQVSLRDHPSGTYMLRVRSDKGSLYRRIVTY